MAISWKSNVSNYTASRMLVQMLAGLLKKANYDTTARVAHKQVSRIGSGTLVVIE